MKAKNDDKTVTFKWHDMGLSFAPAHKFLLDALTIKRKELALDKRTWQRKVVYKSELMMLDPENAALFAQLTRGAGDAGALDNMGKKDLERIMKNTGLKSEEEVKAMWKFIVDNPGAVGDAEREMYVLVKGRMSDNVVTYQGFLSRLMRACVMNGVPFRLEDLRVSCNGGDMPEPRLDLMGGFRFSQEELLTKALKAGKSGLIGAPTRYGELLACL